MLSFYRFSLTEFFHFYEHAQHDKFIHHTTFNDLNWNSIWKFSSFYRKTLCVSLLFFLSIINPRTLKVQLKAIFLSRTKLLPCSRYFVIFEFHISFLLRMLPSITQYQLKIRGMSKRFIKKTEIQSRHIEIQSTSTL